MINLGLGLGLTARPGRSGDAASPKIALVVVAGASNQAGGDPAGTLTAADADPSGRVRQFRWSDGTIVDLSGTIYRPGGEETAKTSPAITFAKAYAATLPATTKVLIVLTSVGGRGVWSGGESGGRGPWNPSGTGPAYVIGGTGSTLNMDGALYLAQAGIRNAVYAACEAEVGAGNVITPIFYGSPINENDVDGPYSTLRTRAARAITGIRAAWGAPSAPWVLPGMVPEWGYAGQAPRPKIDAINKEIPERLPCCAFVEGEVGHMSSENIHYTNAGLRLLGTRAFGGVAIATARSAALGLPVDWLDSLSAARSYGFYRGHASYGTGPAFRLHNGTSETDIAFLADGTPDWAAAEAHVGLAAGYITRMYDTAGSGTWMVPEGTQARGAEVFVQVSGVSHIVFNGRRPTWGNDLNLILLKDTGYSPVAAGAILAVGRFAAPGNKGFVTGPANTLAMCRTGGNLLVRSGTTWRTASVVPAPEPAWIGAGKSYNAYAHYIAGSDLCIDGVPDTMTVGGSATYISAGLGWGGVIGSTNRYSVSSHTQLVAWNVAPTGAALAAVNAMAARF